MVFLLFGEVLFCIGWAVIPWPFLHFDIRWSSRSGSMLSFFFSCSPVRVSFSYLSQLVGRGPCDFRFGDGFGSGPFSAVRGTPDGDFTLGTLSFLPSCFAVVFSLFSAFAKYGCEVWYFRDGC